MNARHYCDTPKSQALAQSRENSQSERAALLETDSHACVRRLLPLADGTHRSSDIGASGALDDEAYLIFCPTPTEPRT